MGGARAVRAIPIIPPRTTASMGIALSGSNYPTTTSIRRRRLVEGAQEPAHYIGGGVALDLAHEGPPRRQEIAVARPALAELGRLREGRDLREITS